MDSRIRNILDNHEKLISMIGSKSLPFKEVLLGNVRDVRKILETSSKKKYQDNAKKSNQ